MSDLITIEGSFEWAMLQLKEGKRVAREGWNGKGMYLLRNPGLMGQSVQEGDYRALAGVEVGTEFDFLPNIEMCNADGNFVPWVSSQADVKADDWYKVKENSAMLIVDLISQYCKKTSTWSFWGFYSLPGRPSETVGEIELIENNMNLNSVLSLRYDVGGLSNVGNAYFALELKFEDSDSYNKYYEWQSNNNRLMVVSVDGEDYDITTLGTGGSQSPSEFTIRRSFDIEKYPSLIDKMKDSIKRRYYIKFLLK